MNRELLWRAWPEGYLNRRGVSTAGGYLAWGNGYWCNPLYAGDWGGHAPAPFFALSGPDAPVVRAGHLLPRVDPADVATWACLLVDLAEAVNARWRREARAARLWEGALTGHLEQILGGDPARGREERPLEAQANPEAEALRLEGLALVGEGRWWTLTDGERDADGIAFEQDYESAEALVRLRIRERELAAGSGA